MIPGKNPNNDNNLISFLIDSGCTDHLVNDKNCFSQLIKLESPIPTAVAKSQNYIYADAFGTIDCIAYVHGQEIKLSINEVFYVPNLNRNLLSVKQLRKNGLGVAFEGDHVYCYNSNGKLYFIGYLNNLYQMDFKLPEHECLLIEKQNPELLLWHQRFAHLHFSGLQKLIQNNLVTGINQNLKFNKIQFCEPCVQGKFSKLPFKNNRYRATRILEIVHTDVCGQIKPISYDKKEYFVTFIDEFSHFTVVYTISNKDEVYECFLDYANKAHSRFFNQYRIHTLRCDNGGEYIPNTLKKFCRDNGIFIDYTIARTPELNGVAERMNRTLMNKVRAMLIESNVPKKFWTEALLAAVYTLNRSPSSTLNFQFTPAEIWYNRKPDVSNLRVFGCVAYRHIDKTLRSKLDSKTSKCVMFGYTTNGYRLWDLSKEKLILERNVKFLEDKYAFQDEKSDGDDFIRIKIQNHYETMPSDESDADDSDDILPNLNQHQNLNQNQNLDRNQNLNRGLNQNQNLNQRPTREIRLPKRLEDYELNFAAFSTFLDEVPKNYNDIKTRKDKSLWEQAMQRELDSIKENDTWDIVDKPVDEPIIKSRWVFALKDYEEKVENKYKARLVAKGYDQEKNTQTDYAPVAKLSTLRALLALGLDYKFDFHQMDVSTAFLHGELDKPVYLRPPKGLEIPKGKVLKLKKALYGLRQSAQCWYTKFNSVMKKYNFSRCENDVCLYTKSTNHGIIYILLYVDDLIIASPNFGLIKTMKENLKQEFKIKDLGTLKHFLGFSIEYDKERGILCISQTHYIEKLLEKFHFHKKQPSHIPIEPKFSIDKYQEKPSDHPVRNLIGSLMYLILVSRPDICFAINYFSRFQDRPSKAVWIGLKRILQYLYATKDLKLVYKRSDLNLGLQGFVDSDWASDTYDRKSTSGYCFFFNQKLIQWGTKKQDTIASSTCEAELNALVMGTQEGLWLHKLINEMYFNSKMFTMYEDNTSCIDVVSIPNNSKKSKHYDVKFRWILEKVQQNRLKIEYVQSKQQVADVFTKGLNQTDFQINRSRLGLEFLFNF